MFKVGDKVTHHHDFPQVIYIIKSVKESGNIEFHSFPGAYASSDFQLYVEKKQIDYLQIAKDVCGV